MTISMNKKPLGSANPPTVFQSKRKALRSTPPTGHHSFPRLFLRLFLVLLLEMIYSLLLLLLLLLLLIPGAHSYVHAPAAIPAHRHVQWLQQMTTDLCRVEPGHLSLPQLSQAPQLLQAWSGTLLGTTAQQLATSSTTPAPDAVVSSTTTATTTATTAVTTTTTTSTSFGPSTGEMNWMMRSSSTLTTSATAPGGLPTRLSPIKALECALAMESLLQRIVQEQRAGNRQAIKHFGWTVHHYNALLEVWARSGQGIAGAERCQQIVETMQQQAMAASTPDHHPSSTDSLPTTPSSGSSSSSFSPCTPRLLLPNLVSFKAVLMAWRQAGPAAAPISAVRAQQVLEYMMNLYQTGQNPQARPDADCFDMVLQLWSRSGLQEAPSQAEQLLAVMERWAISSPSCRPRTTSFNAVLAAWSKSGSPEAAPRAMAILQLMESWAQAQRDAGQEVTAAPDSATYNCVMGAWSHHPDTALAARQADALLRQVETEFRRQQEQQAQPQPLQATPRPPRLVPDTILFNSAMGLWSKANTSRAYRKARSILDRQLALYHEGHPACRPDVFGYTSVLGSCAMESGSAQERAKAFNVAASTYHQLLHDHQQNQEREKGSGKRPAASKATSEPNHVTYGTMLKACARLLQAHSSLRLKYCRQVFEECCRNGYVGDMVVSRLREAASAELYKELMQGYTRKTLPESWTKNVFETNEYRKRKSTHQHHGHHQKKRRQAEV